MSLEFIKSTYGVSTSLIFILKKKKMSNIFLLFFTVLEHDFIDEAEIQ
jgi:hypothetical protein